MTIRNLISRIVLQEDLNFLLTNRVPRQLLTRFMGWFSQIEQPLIRDLSIATWKMFADLDLSDARKTNSAACTTASPANSRRAHDRSTATPRW
jgi:phosphatidylserine decarboxylase